MAARYNHRARRHASPVGSIVLLVVALCVGVVGYFGLRAVDNTGVTYDEETLQREADYLSDVVEIDGIPCTPKRNVRSFLIMGIDDTADKGQGYVTGGQADMLMLIVVDYTHMTYYRVPINRNTLCQVHSYDMEGEDLGTDLVQIAIAHAHGDGGVSSCENTVRAVSDYLYGVDIGCYISLEMGAMATLNHALDGVTVTIEDDFSRVAPSLVMGQTITLTDRQAVIFLRSRMNVGDGTNESRMRRQNRYLDAMRVKLLDKIRENLNFAQTFYNDLQSVMVTNMDVKGFSRLIKGVTDGKNLGTLEIEGRVGKDEFGFSTFEPDPTSVRDTVIKLFYNPVNE